MKLDPVGQSALHKLSEIDIELDRLRFEMIKVSESEDLAKAQADLSGTSEKLIESRSNFENLDSQVARVEDDIRLVTERLDKDKARLNQTSSSKDAMSMQSEIAALEARKTELEEIEYGLLGELEEAEKALQSILQQRESLSEKIQQLQSEVDEKLEELKSQGKKLSADRLIVVEKISSEVLARYEKLSLKQVAVGKIIERACSACHMTLTVGAIDQITSLSEDEIGICPECQAMIVR